MVEMDKSLEKNMYFLFGVSSMWGTFPAVWKNNGLRVTLSVLIIGIVHNVVNSFCCIYITYRGPARSKTTFTIALYHVRSFLVGLFLPVSFMIGIKQVKNLSQFLDELFLVDMYVRSAGIFPKIQLSKWRMYYKLVPLTVSQICVVYAWVKGFAWAWPVDWYFNVVPVIGTMGITFLVCSLVNILGSYLQAIRLPLLAMRRDKTRPVNIVTDMATLHEALSFMAFKLNGIFNFQIFGVISYSFLFSLLHTYYVIRFCRISHRWSLNILIIGNLGCWSLVYFLLGFEIISSASFLTRQAREFNEVLYQLMLDDKTHELLNNEKLKLHIAKKKEVVLTAYGFFNLDYSLLHSMFAAVTTYLVILLQFGYPTEVPKAS